jgi:uncharacterized protein with GYD domain
MPTFMTQFSYTREAWAALAKKPEDRSVPLRALVEKMGGRLLTFHYAFGEYDGVTIYEAPDGQTASAIVLAVAQAGHLSATKTTQLFTVDEAMGTMRKVGGSTYSAPKG